MPLPRKSLSLPPAASLLAMLAAALSPAGCASDSGGRIDISETTQAERESTRIMPIAYVEASDQMSRRLVADLAQVPVVRDAEGPVTIILGDLNNQTGKVDTTEFEMMARRLRGNLLNSRTAGDRLTFVERRARMTRIAEQERVGSEGYAAQPPDYAPGQTFALNGDFFRVGRGDTQQYYMEMTLSHFGSNQIVWSDRYEIKQVKGG